MRRYPTGIDGSQITFEFAFSPVFGPGGSGTFEAPFEEGHTYAALCFISDREGGLPTPSSTRCTTCSRSPAADSRFDDVDHRSAALADATDRLS